jgi:Putative beta-barrel porin-2, OmpL-like. bbp2
MKKNSSGIPLLLVLSAALLATPVCKAKASIDSSQSAADLSKRVADLEKQLTELQGQLSALKTTPPTPAATATTTPPTATAAVASGTTAEPSAPAKTDIASLLGPTSISGFVDAYYNYNSNQPATRQSSFRAFDTSSNTLALNMVELVVDKAPDAASTRFGYHLGVGFGQGMNAINAAEPGGPGFDQYLKEAYLSYLAPVGKGLQVDFGKFVTPEGAEVIESKDNWNYSRGLLFWYAIPLYHFGLRAKYTFNDKYAVSGFLVNGWNNVVENNSGKTYGASFAWTPTKKLGFTQTLLAGPEQANSNQTWRQTWDTVVSYNATSKLSFLFNYDYGRGDRPVDPVTLLPIPTAPVVYWTGIAGYVKYAWNDKYSFATRYEYYNDHSGFTTGTAQHINEITTTLQRTVRGNLLTRLEFRRDMSNEPTILKNANTFVKDQNTVTAGVILTFDSREAK